MISICLITGDVNFNHLVRWCLPGFSAVKLLIPLQLISIFCGSLLHCLVWDALGLELRALPALTQSQSFHPGALDLHKAVFSPVK